MHPIIVGPWQLRVDREATREAHAAPRAAGDACHCRECRNMDAALARPDTVPPELRDLLATLGADDATWSRRFHVDALPSGRHLYGGWLHVVGEVVAGPDARVPVGDGTLFELRLTPLGPHAAIGFSRATQLVPEAITARPLVQVELQVELPWCLDEPHEDRWARPEALAGEE